MNPDAIPQELRERAQWLLWDGRADRPRRPHWDGNFSVSWSNPDAWHTFSEAVTTADSEDAWGIGYVTAANNDAHPMGVMSVIDIDGAATPDDTPKDWLPSLQPFFDRDAYMEWSPSHDEAGDSGIHIPVAGLPPEWWSDTQVAPDKHEGVDVLSNKFCTVTGDTLDGAGAEIVVWDDWAEAWLADAYEALTGETAPPRRSSDTTPATEDSEQDYDDEWLDEGTVAEALDHIDPNCEYETWRNVGFGLADHFDSHTAKNLFDGWSRRGSKYDKDAEHYIEDIANRGSGDVGIGTVVHHAKQGGWEPGGSAPTSAAQEATARAEPDGGTTTADSPDSDSGPYQSLQERVATQVVTPVDPPEDWDGEQITLEVALDRFTELLLGEYAFVRPREDVRGWRDKLYVYDDESGVYEPHGESFIESEAERLLGPLANNQRCNEIVQKIERKSLVRPGELTADPHRVVVANGIVDLHTGALDAHTPEEYHRTCLDWAYDPDADCERIDAFFHEIVDDSDVRTLYQLVAHTIYKEYLEEKAAMLLGDGENGKSVFLQLLTEFLGDYNVSRRSLQDFARNDFAANNLQGKLANLHPDMASESVDELGVFKQLTGRDPLVADVKYEKPIHFENHATLVFAANRMPQMNEDTHALWRRWIYVNFPYTFSERDPEAKDPTPKRKLMRELTDEAEMSGLLTRAVEELTRWHDTGELFTDVAGPEQVREKMKRASEPVYDFAMTCLEDVEDDDAYLPKEQVRKCYREFARVEGLPSIPDSRFGERLLHVRDLAIESGQRRHEKQRMHVYQGVQFSSRGRQILGLDENDTDEELDGENSHRWEKARDAVRDLEREESAPSKANVVGKLSNQMSIPIAQDAVERALERGAIYEAGGGGLRVT